MVKLGSEREAARYDAAVQKPLSDLERGKLALPPAADAATIKAFVLSAGMVAKSTAVLREEGCRATPGLTLGDLFARYDAGLTPGSKGTGTRTTEKIHANHFRRVIGIEVPLATIDLATLQKYVDARARAVGRQTIAKELVTLGVVWRWATDRGFAPAPAWDRRG